MSRCYHHEDISKESKPGTFLMSSDIRLGMIWAYVPVSCHRNAAQAGSLRYITRLNQLIRLGVIWAYVPVSCGPNAAQAGSMRYMTGSIN